MGDGSFVIRREGECNFFADKGCAVAPDTFELTPELEAERRTSSDNRLAMIGARSLMASRVLRRSACLHPRLCLRRQRTGLRAAPVYIESCNADCSQKLRWLASPLTSAR